MQFGIMRGPGVGVSAAENPAFIVKAPLSMTRIFAGGGGPEAFVLRWLGAMVDSGASETPFVTPPGYKVKMLRVYEYMKM